VIVHCRENRVAEWTARVPRQGHPRQISERKVVAVQMIYRANQAVLPTPIVQFALVPLPAAVEECLETDKHLVSATDLFS
jgi:hypothetical protein